MVIAHLSPTAPVAGASLEALCRVLCHCSALGRGKVSGSIHLSLTAPVACPSLEALYRVLCHCSALGARTGRALQNGLHTEREPSFGSAIDEGPSGESPSSMAQHSPCPKAPLPEGSSSMEMHPLCPWAVRSSFAVRALCAHQRKRNASHKAKRFQRRRGGGVGRERIVRSSRPFPRGRAPNNKGRRTRAPPHADCLRLAKALYLCLTPAAHWRAARCQHPPS